MKANVEMRWVAVVCVLVALSANPQGFADDLAKQKLADIDSAVEQAIARGEIPGAVVVVHGDRIVYRKAFGHRSLKPEKVPMTVDTVFDMASLTKPMATATSAMLLIQQGKLKPSDRVTKYWPEFAVNGKDKVTVEHLLLHTSGLIADNALSDYSKGGKEALRRIAALPLKSPPGERFRYSDVGFIVLGELVERISGKPLDEFARKQVFDPLKMADTVFRPNETLRKRVAPTEPRTGKYRPGEVHDPRAFALGGVAGHAGLFSTADDVALFCRMLLRGGELGGVRLLDTKTVKSFIAPHPVPIRSKKGDKRGLRTYGWDVDTAYSSPRGSVFPKGTGFGHTGFTGTSVWIEPKSDVAIIILTNRVHPDRRGNATPLRRAIGSIVAKAVGKK